MSIWRPGKEKVIAATEREFALARNDSLLADRLNIRSPLRFSGLALFASIARTKALRRVDRAVLRALAHGAQQLVCALVDNDPDAFALTKHVHDLADSTRTGVSSDLGAGIADLVMSTCGFVYRDNARTLVPRGRVADFLYAGMSPRSRRPLLSRNQVAFVEAKGNFSAKASPASLLRMVSAGFRDQVDRHVRQTYGRMNVVHGCAIGVGGRPGALHSHVHVEQSPVRDPTTPGMASKSGPELGESKGASPAPAARDDNALVVLGNYAGALRLVGKGEAAAVVDYVFSTQRSGQSWTKSGQREVVESVARAFQFVDGEPEGVTVRKSDRPFTNATFSLDARVAAALREQIIELVLERRQGFELPIGPLRGIESGERVEFPDGLVAESERDEWTSPIGSGESLWIPPDLGTEVPEIERSMEDAMKALSRQTGDFEQGSA